MFKIIDLMTINKMEFLKIEWYDILNKILESILAFLRGIIDLLPRARKNSIPRKGSSIISK